MALWIPITFAAAFLQNLRTALQRQIAESVDATGATLARYLFGFPFAICYVAVLGGVDASGLPATNTGFFVNCAVGGAAQILATVLLVASFSLRSFASATTYSKTEVIFTTFVSAVLLGEFVSLPALGGILIAFAGVVVLSAKQGAGLWHTLVRGWRQRAALYAIAAGALFGVSSACFRGGALALDPDYGVFTRAGMVLAVTYTGQALTIAAYVLARRPGQFTRVIALWRAALPIGFTAVIGSCGWFTAVAMTNAAYVRAVGQVELIFSLLTSVLIFRERISQMEIIGMAITLVGILIVLLTR